MAIPFRRGLLPALLASALTPGLSLAAEPDLQLENIEVISLTPLHGVGLEADKIPSHVQTATDEDIERNQSLDISDFMNQTMGSMSINHAQNNPFQPDLNSVVSPLLHLSVILKEYRFIRMVFVSTNLSAMR